MSHSAAPRLIGEAFPVGCETACWSSRTGRPGRHGCRPHACRVTRTYEERKGCCWMSGGTARPRARSCGSSATDGCHQSWPGCRRAPRAPGRRTLAGRRRSGGTRGPVPPAACWLAQRGRARPQAGAGAHWRTAQPAWAPERCRSGSAPSAEPASAAGTTAVPLPGWLRPRRADR